MVGDRLSYSTAAFGPTHSRRTLITTPPLQKWTHIQPGLTQVIHSDMHLEAVAGFRVRTHHHAGVVDEYVKLVYL